MWLNRRTSAYMLLAVSCSNMQKEGQKSASKKAPNIFFLKKNCISEKKSQVAQIWGNSIIQPLD